jgi:hypothetical protein
MTSNIYLDYINKRKNSDVLTGKYKVIDCQNNVNKNVNTTNWIKLNQIIKSKDNIKIIEGIMMKMNIIIKIGKMETIEREYRISQLLGTIPCFIKYLCYFSCNNNLQNIINNSSVCANDGDKLHVLLMKQYPNDIKSYNWTKENFIVLKSLVKQIFISLFIAFQKYGLIHSDTHFGNYLMKKTNDSELKYAGNSKEQENIVIKLYGYKVVIIDFENSLFESSYIKNYYYLYTDFKKIINNLLYELKLNISNINDINTYLDDNIKNKTIIDIEKLLLLVDNLVMNNKIDMSTLKYEYNPNIF